MNNLIIKTDGINDLVFFNKKETEKKESEKIRKIFEEQRKILRRLFTFPYLSCDLKIKNGNIKILKKIKFNK